MLARGMIVGLGKKDREVLNEVISRVLYEKEEHTTGRGVTMEIARRG